MLEDALSSVSASPALLEPFKPFRRPHLKQPFLTARDGDTQPADVSLLNSVMAKSCRYEAMSIEGDRLITGILARGQSTTNDGTQASASVTPCQAHLVSIGVCLYSSLRTKVLPDEWYLPINQPTTHMSPSLIKLHGCPNNSHHSNSATLI
jgi:hypothetical protein